MDESDKAVLRKVVDALTDKVAELHHPDGISLADLVDFQELLTEANFYVSGIIYSAGEICIGHDDDE